MSEKINPETHVGEIHGPYRIVEALYKRDKYGHWLYKSICEECGRVKISPYGALTRTKKTLKCRHLKAENVYVCCEGSKWKNRRLYGIFRDMVRRCYDETDSAYCWYGKKNVKIFKGWLANPLSFEKWALRSGYNEHLTIDRIDPNKDYCPNNCQWIELNENARKAGKVNWITINGECLTGRQWSEKLGLGVNSINKFIRNYGLPKTEELIKAMLVTPPSKKYRKSHQTWFSAYGIEL